MKIDKITYVQNPEKVNGVQVVNDAFQAIALLEDGHAVARFEFGDSMSPLLKSGEYCILEPMRDNMEAEIGDAVFCNVNGYVMTHMVLMKAKNDADDKPYYQIGSTSGDIYGWTNVIYAIAHGTRVLEKESFIEN
ncbi:MAG: hypothetical protein IKT40_08845 [Bacilli bacterium]|nr:hypothetical protein [Bacilli bacterium]